MTRIQKMFEMIEILSRRGVVSLGELADRFEVDIRTVQRMRDELVDAGYTIKTHRGPDGGIELITSKPYPITDYTERELADINLGLAKVLSMPDLQGEKVKDAISKLKRDISKNFNYRVIEGVSTRQLNIDPELYNLVVDSIQKAIKNQQKIEFKYRNKKTYTIEPYELFVVNNNLYVGGLNKQYDSRNFRVSRFESIELLDQKFIKDASLYKSQTEELLGFDFETLRVKVRVCNFDYIKEYIWGQDQEIIEVNANTFEMSVTFGNVFYAREFLMIGGKHIEILEPESLKASLIKEAQEILSLYEVSS